MFCPNCGNQISEESMFCGNCGTAVSKIPLNEEPIVIVPPVEEVPMAVAPPVEAAPTTESIPVEEAVIDPQVDMAATRPMPTQEELEATMAFAPYMEMDAPQSCAFSQDLPEEQNLFDSGELPPVSQDYVYEEPYQQQGVIPPSQQPQGQMQYQEVPVIPEPEPAAAPPAPKQKNVTVIILMGVLCGLVLALAIYFVCLMFPNLNLFGPAEKEEETTSQSSQKDKDKEKEEKEPITLPEDNIYAPYFSEEMPYILENSDTVYYGRKDLMQGNKLISVHEMNIALQEIYARHGDVTDDEDLQEYFAAQPWYQQNNASYSLNACEKANVLLIKTNLALAQNRVELNRNPYLAYIDDEDFVIHYTSTDYIHKEDVNWLNNIQLILVKNTIFARKGHVFEDQQLQEFFYCMDWYVPNPKIDITKSGVLNHFEDSNSKVLDIWIMREEGVEFSDGNPYEAVYYEYITSKYVFKSSSTSSLNEYSVYTLDADTLCIARNEILARHGYTFTDEELLEYFLQWDWYQPTLPPGSNDDITLTDIEKKNIALIQDAEAKLKELNNLDTSLSYTVQCGKFSVKVPAYWKNYGVQTSNGAYYGFYEKESYYGVAGGHLFTFALYNSANEYNYLPQYQLVGYIEDSNGNVQHLVAVFPSDVQYDAKSATIYHKMYDEFDRIADTIVPASGYSYTDLY